MPAPSPINVITLWAKVDTVVRVVRPYSPAIATVMLSTLISSGSPVATSAPNTSSSTRAVSGRAVNSARLLSDSANSVKSSAIACPPVSCTVNPAAFWPTV